MPPLFSALLVSLAMQGNELFVQDSLVCSNDTTWEVVGFYYNYWKVTQEYFIHGDPSDGIAFVLDQGRKHGIYVDILQRGDHIGVVVVDTLEEDGNSRQFTHVRVGDAFIDYINGIPFRRGIMLLPYSIHDAYWNNTCEFTLANSANFTLQIYCIDLVADYRTWDKLKTCRIMNGSGYVLAPGVRSGQQVQMNDLTFKDGKLVGLQRYFWLDSGTVLSELEYFVSSSQEVCGMRVRRDRGGIDFIDWQCDHKIDHLPERITTRHYLLKKGKVHMWSMRDGEKDVDRKFTFIQRLFMKSYDADSYRELSNAFFKDALPYFDPQPWQ